MLMLSGHLSPTRSCLKTVDDLVYQSFDVTNSTIRRYDNFQIEQKDHSETFKTKCEFLPLTSLVKCPIKRPKRNWKLSFQDNDTVLDKFDWDFDLQKCVCSGIKPVYKFKVRAVDNKHTAFKVECIYQKYSNMLSVGTNSVFLDYGDNILQESCNNKVIFIVNDIDVCVSASICSTSTFQQCSNKVQPYCVPFQSIRQVVVKDISCQVSQKGLKVSWGLFDISGIKHLALDIYSEKANTGQHMLLLSKNISSTQKNFQSGELIGSISEKELSVRLMACSHCKCFDGLRTKCSVHFPTFHLPKENSKSTLLIVLVTFSVLFVFISTGGPHLFSFVFKSFYERKMDKEKAPIEPRTEDEHQSHPHVDQYALYEEIPMI